MKKITYTNQEAFDVVCKGLASQDFEHSMTPNGLDCAYRGAEGRKCAAGWLIPDDLYSPDFEGNSFLEIYGSSIFDNDALSVNLDLVRLLQRAHDVAANPEHMRENLRGVAFRYGLQVPECLQECDEAPDGH